MRGEVSLSLHWGKEELVPMTQVVLPLLPRRTEDVGDGTTDFLPILLHILTLLKLSEELRTSLSPLLLLATSSSLLQNLLHRGAHRHFLVGQLFAG